MADNFSSALEITADAYAEAINERREWESKAKASLEAHKVIQQAFAEADLRVKAARDALLAEARGDTNETST